MSKNDSLDLMGALRRAISTTTGHDEARVQARLDDYATRPVAPLPDLDYENLYFYKHGVEPEVGNGPGIVC